MHRLLRYINWIRWYQQKWKGYLTIYLLDVCS